MAKQKKPEGLPRIRIRGFAQTHILASLPSPPLSVRLGPPADLGILGVLKDLVKIARPLFLVI